MTCRKDPVIEVVLAKIFISDVLALGFSWVCGIFFLCLAHIVLA